MSRKDDDRGRFVDLPEVSETFADSVGGILFHKGVMRILLYVTRSDEPTSTNGEPNKRRHPACRLVLTEDAAAELLDRLSQLAQVMKADAQNPDPSGPKVVH